MCGLPCEGGCYRTIIRASNIILHFLLNMFSQVTPKLVPGLTDSQLSELGVPTMGDRAALRAACQQEKGLSPHNMATTLHLLE